MGSEDQAWVRLDTEYISEFHRNSRTPENKNNEIQVLATWENMIAARAGECTRLDAANVHVDRHQLTIPVSQPANHASQPDNQTTNHPGNQPSSPKAFHQAAIQPTHATHRVNQLASQGNHHSRPETHNQPSAPT